MTLPEIADFIKTVGFPVAVAGFVLWRLDRRLGDLVTATRDLSDPDKTAARLRPLFQEHTRDIVADVGHDTRGAVGPLMAALSRRDSESVVVLHDIHAKLDRLGKSS